MMPEKEAPQEKRFGMIAIEKGFITKEQLADGLREQVDEEVERGTHSFIGAILLAKKAIDAQQLRLVVEQCMNRTAFVA
ncbi:MAG: hypothetical protein JXL84_14765 [Deltaproteobacteria bacterium]|nr:hypothetical protein [Deltaproteobacteria bacterium]